MWITTIMKIILSIVFDMFPIVLVIMQYDYEKHDGQLKKLVPIYLIGLTCHIIFEIIYLLFLLKPFYKEKGSYDTLIGLNIATFFAVLSIDSVILNDPSDVKSDKVSYKNSYEGHLFSIRSSKNSSKTCNISLDYMITKVNNHAKDSDKIVFKRLNGVMIASFLSYFPFVLINNIQFIW